jgi:hypothetical protein
MRRAHIVVAVLGLAAGACVPTLPGPQLTDPPSGLGYAAPRGDPAGTFGTRAGTLERAWFALQEPRASVTILGYQGRITRSELDEWLAGRKASPGGRSPVEPVRIDGRDAWMWSEGPEPRHVVGALVPYADESFLIWMASARPGEDEARLRAAVRSFRREPGSSLRWAVPAGVLALVGLAAWARRVRRPAEPRPVVSRPMPPRAPRADSPRNPASR